MLKRTWKFDLFIIFSCLLVYLVYDHGVNHYFKVPAMLSTVLGTAIAFFIGFNNNQAYSRWWEARTIWGALVNDSRSWTRSLLAYVRESKDSFDNSQIQMLRKRMIYRHLAFLYALKYALRKISDTSDSIVRTIEINTLEALNEQDIPEPVKPVNNEYIL